MNTNGSVYTVYAILIELYPHTLSGVKADKSA